MKPLTLASFNATATPFNKTGRSTTAIVSAWLLAGTLDILAAIIHAGAQGVSATSVLKAVASGAMGAEAFRGGNAAAMIGLGLHFAIMFTIVLCSWQLIQRIKWLATQPWRTGAALGLGVYAVMNLAVLPLSAIAYKPSYSWSSLLIGIGIHILCVGLPIAWILQRCVTQTMDNAEVNP